MSSKYAKNAPRWYTFHVQIDGEGDEAEYKGRLFVADSPGQEGNFDDNSYELTHKDWEQNTEHEVIHWFMVGDGYEILKAGNYLVLCPTVKI